MNLAIRGLLLWTFCIQLDKTCVTSQITKLLPIEDWIAFKRDTSNIKPLDKFIGKLRATYDFVFHKPDNVSNIETILNEKMITHDDVPEKFILSTTYAIDNNLQNQSKERLKMNKIHVELFPTVNTQATTSRESSISRISKDNEWLNDDDDIQVPEPLSELEIVDDIDRSIETMTQQPSFELPIAVARAIGKWLGSILGFTRGAYLKLTHSSA